MKKCKRCGIEKSPDGFYPHRRICKQCRNEQCKATLDPAHKRDYDAARYQKLKSSKDSQSKDWASNNKERIRAANRDLERKHREQVISGYGGKCACCGEDNYYFLSIDHVFNDGAKERKEKRLKSLRLYRHIIDSAFPDKYQVLCYNCNCSKGTLGICAHKLKEPRVHIQSA